MDVSKVLSALAMCVAIASCGGNSHSEPDADHDSVADSRDCAPSDPQTWQLLTYNAVDKDADGHQLAATGQVCSGAGLPAGYSSTAPQTNDCNDTDAARWQLLPYSAVDADADGHWIASTGQVCSGANLPTAYSTVIPQADASDCDDTNAATWRFMMTFTDRDADGIGAGTGTSMCTGNATAAGFSLYGYDPIDDPSDPNAGSVADFDLSAGLLTTP
jgi:hypothetical protein